MDEKLVNPFVMAAMNVLDTMAFVKATAQKPYLKTDNSAPGDVSGIVAFTGEATGTVSITFDEACIIQIVSNMFGEEIKEMNEEVIDAVGELTNMISGNARMEIETTGKVLHGGIPTVIIGKNHQLTSMAKGPIIAIPFETDAGNYTIEICFK